MSTPTAVVYVHAENEGPFLLAGALAAQGFRVEERLRAPDPRDAHAPLVCVMGGPMGVYEAKDHPFLGSELAVLRDRLAGGRPCIGICLGAQLLAAAAGARVYCGTPGVEIGVDPLTLTPAGVDDGVLSGLTGQAVAHWHGDTFELPKGAVLLASTPRYAHQAFRLGPSYGLQFHPELDAETFRSWVDGSAEELQRYGLDGRDLWTAAAALTPSRPARERALQRLVARVAEHAR